MQPRDLLELGVGELELEPEATALELEGAVERDLGPGLGVGGLERAGEVDRLDVLARELGREALDSPVERERPVAHRDGAVLDPHPFEAGERSGRRRRSPGVEQRARAARLLVR